MRLYIKKAIDIKKIFLLSVLTSLALVLSVIEAWIQIPIGISGVKLGLANVITIVLLIFFSFSDALVIILIRCIVSSLFIGGPVIFMFSLCGGILSAATMWVLLKTTQKWLSLVGISVAGSIGHNIAQIAVVCFIMNDLSIATYLPKVLIYGVVMGCFVGYCTTYLVKAMKKLNLIENI